MSSKPFKQGRDNLAVTVYVPWDCDNNCEFCTSKDEYNGDKNFPEIQRLLKKVNSSKIQEVVITGGEPCKNIVGLSSMLKCTSDKKVYINTTLLKSRAVDFISLVNSCENVKGVNISRHSNEYDDEKLLNICEDYYLGYIKSPIHINIVNPKLSDIETIIQRYSKISKIRKSCGFGSLTICIRSDFTKTNEISLHRKDDETLKYIGNNGFELVSHNYCNVCDTNTFKIRDGFYISYHRGLKYTSIEKDEYIEVNDIVIYPDGTLCYDWSKWVVCDESIFETLLGNNNLYFRVPEPCYPSYNPPNLFNCMRPYDSCNDSINSMSCGGHGC